MRDNIFQKDNSYEQFIKKMDDIILELSSKMKNIIQKNNNEVNDNNNKKHDYFKKEIEHFENHILSEHDKFIQFIQNHFDEQNNSIKKLFDYNSEDIDILKARTENLENSIKKLRTDVFKGINETEEFLEKKYER